MRTMQKQFLVTQLTYSEVVDFRNTRFHPKQNGGQSGAMRLWYG